MMKIRKGIVMMSKEINHTSSRDTLEASDKSKQYVSKYNTLTK